MLGRTLILSLCLGAALIAFGASGAPAKPGEKGTLTLPAMPPITKVAIDFACTLTPDQGRVDKLDCHNTGGPYPYPPKDTKVYKVRDPISRATLTLYPDGEVTLIVYVKN
jgi:hypothetical protein